ncbi:hypothetical protein MIS45_00035 [Wielerella bovis]|uniref:hypothetical protein n=1 Tax=Wielerella bovis TaxID=2917790 RepID=UPI002019506F|nr:hypothetical protein [Wielerella bovis]ULJ69310.1 hypothetical protein MIS45_00035 [Wielerella bovis]
MKPHILSDTGIRPTGFFRLPFSTRQKSLDCLKPVPSPACGGGLGWGWLVDLQKY